MLGNTSDKTIRADFLKTIEARYGKAHRTWVMDRGIPTEETLAQMRAAEPPVYYLVGTPRGRLSKLEQSFLQLPVVGSRNIKRFVGQRFAFAQSALAYPLSIYLARRRTTPQRSS